MNNRINNFVDDDPKGLIGAGVFQRVQINAIGCTKGPQIANVTDRQTNRQTLLLMHCRLDRRNCVSISSKSSDNFGWVWSANKYSHLSHALAERWN